MINKNIYTYFNSIRDFLLLIGGTSFTFWLYAIALPWGIQKSVTKIINKDSKQIKLVSLYSTDYKYYAVQSIGLIKANIKIDKIWRIFFYILVSF